MWNVTHEHPKLQDSWRDLLGVSPLTVSLCSTLLLSIQFPVSREMSRMSKIRKQKQLEALFMKILAQVRGPGGQVTEGGS